MTTATGTLRSTSLIDQFVDEPTDEQVARIEAHNRKKAERNSADNSAGSKKKPTATQKAVTDAHGKAKNAKKSPLQVDGVKPRASKGDKDLAAAATAAAATASQARMMLDVQKERNKGLARTMKAAARIKGEAIKDAVAAQSKAKFRLHRTQALDAKVDKMADRLVNNKILSPKKRRGGQSATMACKRRLGLMMMLMMMTTLRSEQWRACAVGVHMRAISSLAPTGLGICADSRQEQCAQP